MSNYYVRRTGDDSDYLAHANMMATDSGGKRHKYLFKINIGGKPRYFYDPRELDAYKRAQSGIKAAGSAVSGAFSNVRRSVGRTASNLGRSASRFVDQNITGATSRRLAGAYRRGVKSANGMSAKNAALRNAKKYEGQYNRSLVGRMANVGNAARNFVGQQATRARKAGSSFAGSISDRAYKVAGAADKAIGISARKKAKKDRLSAEAYEKSYGATRRYGRASESTMAKMYRKMRQKANQAATSENIYNRSLLGRAESALDSASDFLKKKKRKKQAKANLARNNTTSLRANVKKSAAEKSKKIKGMQQVRQLKNAHTRNRHYMV